MSAKIKLSDRDVRGLRNVGVRTTYAKAGAIVGISATHARDIILRRRRASVPDHPTEVPK